MSYNLALHVSYIQKLYLFPIVGIIKRDILIKCAVLRIHEFSSFQLWLICITSVLPTLGKMADRYRPQSGNKVMLINVLGVL